MSKDKKSKNEKSDTPEKETPQDTPKEIGGRGGLDPARYGDWESNGKCVDF